MSRTQRENVYTQASFFQPVWEQAIKIINLFENGKLGGRQRLNKKSLMSKPEFKPHHFQCLHNLDQSFQKDVLEKVVNKTITLNTMKKKATEYRALENIKNAFMKVTRVSSWQEALEQYPRHTQEKNLCQFLGLNFIKNIPEAFRNFCKSGTTTTGEPTVNNSVQVYQGAEAAVVEADFAQLEDSGIIRVCPSYTGAGLILMNIPTVSTLYCW